MQGIVHIINFIRALEPRPGCNPELLEPVIQQMKLAKQYHLPVTWLIQYDTLLSKPFQAVLQEVSPDDEIGIWLEIVQPLVEKAGLVWRGRYPWDWHANVGFSVGYTPEERVRMVDIFITDFEQHFGFKPRSVGSWFIDAHTLAHLEKQHGIIASCNCKDQWGTDGYTLWGGYFNQAYYPSRNNSYIPAQNKDQQISIPVFRMLGSDPIHQYEVPLGNGHGQAVVTLEPVWSAGSKPEWVDHFFKNMFDSPCLSFGYTQVGQENSFGWPAMSAGLTYQHKQIARMRDEGTIRIETLSQSGKWFRETYPLTPASAVVMQQDMDAPQRGALWYCSRNYRTSLIWDGEDFRIRDMQLFDEFREEPFLHLACKQPSCQYDALPIMDGLLWSRQDYRAGFRLIDSQGATIPLQRRPQIHKQDSLTLIADLDNRFRFTFSEDQVHLQGPTDSEWSLTAQWHSEAHTAFQGIRGDLLQFCHADYPYAIRISNGRAIQKKSGFSLQPDNSGQITIRMH